MSDEFFREVNEEYRRDQVSHIWKKYNTLIMGAIALIVIGVGGYRYWEGAQLSKAQQAGANFAQAINLAQTSDFAAAEKALAALGKEGPTGYAMLAKFTLAGDLSLKDKDAALREYNALAADGNIAPEWRDLAKLRSAMLRMDGKDASSARSDLELLAGANGPWRITASEMLLLSHLQQGDYAAARRWLETLNKDVETPAGVRGRLTVYTSIIAGGPVEREK